MCVWVGRGLSESVNKGNIYEKILLQIGLNEVLKSSKMTSAEKLM